MNISIRSSKLKECIFCFVITLLILIPGFNFICIQPSVGVNEPITTDNLNGNWTASWSVENPDNYTLTNVILKDNKATLATIDIIFDENLTREYSNGTNENLKILEKNGIGLDLTLKVKLLIADVNNHRVLETDYNNWLWQYGTNSTPGVILNRLNNPNFAIRLANNRILITDTGNNRVIEVGYNFEFYWQFGSNSSSGIGDDLLNSPMSAVPMANGNILIADAGNNYIIEVNRSKNIVWQYDTGLAFPRYAEELSNGSILITDTENHRVIEVNKIKQQYWQHGTGSKGFGENELEEPSHATRLSNGNTLISDTKKNHRVVEVNNTNNIVWQYGITKVPGFVEGRLNRPTCAVRLNDGNTIITDSLNDRVIIVDNSKNWLWQYGYNNTPGVGVNYLNTPRSGLPILKNEIQGFYTSKVLDGGNKINWTNIKWESIVPTDTQLKLSTRTGDNPFPTGGGWSQWSNIYQTPSGSQITSPVNRYIQYKAEFITNDINTTPTLAKVNITGSRFEPNGNLITEFFVPVRLIKWIRLIWDAEVNGQTLRPYYQTNSSLPWQLLGSSGDLKNVSTDTGKIRFRFIFSTTNTTISPILHEFSLIFERLDQLDNIKVIPNPVDVVAGEEFKFIATGYDIYNREVTINPSWTTTVGTITDGTLVAQTTRGSGFVNATQNSITGSAVVNIIPGALAYIEVIPGEVEVIATEIQVFNAVGYDKYKNEVIIDPVWSTNVGVMTDNIFTAQNFAGMGRVTAKVGNITGIANITVKLNESIHHPPSIKTPVPDQLKPEDSEPWTITLTTYEFDLEDSVEQLLWYITDVDTGMCKVTGSYSKDDVLKFIPEPNAYGNNKATLWLKDSDNMTTSQAFWINITPVNDKPVIKNIPDIMVHYDEPYIFDYSNYVSDVETPKNQLILSIQEPTGQAYTSVNGLNVTFNYPKITIGQVYTLKLLVSDNIATVEDIFKVTISENHGPKLIKNLPDITMNEGETKNFVFDLDEYFMDPDGDKLKYSSSATNLKVTHHDNNSISISSTGAWSGIDTITFRAIDPFGAMAEAAVKVHVIGINDPPRISPIPDLYVHYDYEYKFDLSYYINDPDNDTRELMLWTTDPEHILFTDLDNTIMTLFYPELFLDQTVLITIFVTDGIDIASRDFFVHITDNFPPIVKKELKDIYFDEDAELINALNLNDYFSDPDDNILEFSYELLDKQNITIKINENFSVDISSLKDWYGTSSVIFKAQDPKMAFVQSRILIVVIPVNDPPIISLIPEQRGKVDERWILDLSSYLADVDDDLSDLEISIGPDYAHLVNVTGKQLIFHSSKPVDLEIIFAVSDGNLKTPGAIHLIITGRETEDTLFWIWILLTVIILIILASIGITAYKRRGNFVITDVFIIHRDGLLIKYLGTSLKQELDEDIVSGMLTGIQSFITHSFSTQSKDKDLDWGIKQLKMADRELMIERGENIYLTVIYDGTPGQRLPKLLSKVVTKIENKYGGVLKEWGGKESSIRGIEDLIDPILKTEE